VTRQDSWPPVSKPQPASPSKIRRWAWIPAILVVPAIGVGTYLAVASQQGEPPPEEKRDALGALAAGSTRPETKPPTAATQPVPEPVAFDRQTEEPAEPAGVEDPVVPDDTFDEGSPEGDDLDGELAADPEAEGDDDPVSVTDAEGGFWIQAASLKLKEKADALAEKLSDKGYRAQSMAYGGPRAGWWHVVRLGPYDTRMDAERARIAFTRAERMKTAVVPRAHGPYQIQLASLRSETRANKMVRRLGRLGHNARVGTVKTRSNGTWYTIRVGPFDFESEVLAYQDLLEADGFEGRIRPRPKQPPENENADEKAEDMKTVRKVEEVEKIEEGPFEEG